MSITEEQNDQINKMRLQLTNMLTALNQLAREVGADPIPMDITVLPTMPPQLFNMGSEIPPFFPPPPFADFPTPNPSIPPWPISPIGDD